MIRVTETNETTQQFLHDVSEMALDAAELGGTRAKKALQAMAEHVATRDVSQLSPVDPAGVKLTDDQWEQLAKRVRIEAGFSTESM